MRRFQITVYRDANAETGIENVLKGPHLLRILRILDMETGGEF
jgi:hypothetical protein